MLLCAIILKILTVIYIQITNITKQLNIKILKINCILICIIYDKNFSVWWMIRNTFTVPSLYRCFFHFIIMFLFNILDIFHVEAGCNAKAYIFQWNTFHSMEGH